MNWKSFFEFSDTEAVGVLVTVVIVVLTFYLNVRLSNSNNSVVLTENDSLVMSFERMQNDIKESSILLDKELIASRNGAITIDGNGNRNDKGLTDYPQKKSKQGQQKYIKQEKLSASEFISLNKSDTADWKKIPGIGSSYAKRIVKYRNLLGGYKSVEQLKEVYGFTDELYDKVLPFVQADKSIIKLDINKLEFKEILAHPYIDYEQTKAIMNLRRRIGRIESVEELGMLDEFSSDDIIRISPYLKF